MTRTLLGALIACCLGAAPVMASKDEIMARVVDPCYAHMVENNPDLANLGVPKDEAIELLKIFDEGAVDHLIEVMLPTLEGKTQKQKDALYKFGLAQCLRGQKDAR